MGIQNLLPLLEKSTKKCNISEFRGLSVAVDSYCWLHKGAICCATQLVKGEETDLYIHYFIKYVKLLLKHDIKPIMVFDGRVLPAKLSTEEKRREIKKNARKQGMELLRLGKPEDAYKYFRQCIDITPQMALAVIKECRKLGVDCIVAPYESDSQLAYFNIKGIVHFVISEDSDLLLFGCKKVLYKMDINGNGQLVEADKLHVSMKLRPDQYTFNKFRHMCILSGCDYIESLPGIGLKKALKFVTMTAENNPEIFLDRMPRYLNMKQLCVTDDYKERFLMADATFKHQIVYDPINRQLVPLNPVDCNTKLIHCKNSGTMFDAELAFQLAIGNLNPLTMEKMANWLPDSRILPVTSIWSNCFTSRSQKRGKKSPAETITKKRKVLMKEDTDENDDDDDNDNDNALIDLYKNAFSHKTEEGEAAGPSVDRPLSPVIRSVLNPFMRIRLNNKHRTFLDDDKVVKSRFFNPSSLESDNKEEEESKTDCMWFKEMQQQQTTDTTSSDTSGIVDSEKSELPTPENTSDVQELSQMSKLSLSLETNVGGQCSSGSDTENVRKDKGSYTIIPYIECECVLEVDENVEIKTSPKPCLKRLASVENLPETSAVKKPKKLPSKSKRQPTITEMFCRMRRD